MAWNKIISKFLHVRLFFIEKVNIIIKEDEQNRVWCVAFLKKGDNAYVIRTSLFGIYIHTIDRTCNGNCCRCFLIDSISCYNKKIRQRKKHISAWPLEMYLL